jgi:outer membrane immunogenic protein
MKLTALALSSVATVALLGSALAADLPVRSAAPAPVMALPVANWTGFYVGAAIGGVSSDISLRNYEDYSSSMNQFTAGGYVGYNHQFGNFVAGLEGDVNARFGDKELGYFNGPSNNVISSNWDASIRLRFGFLVTPRALIYATGGVAFSDYSAQAVVCCPTYIEALGGNRTGWTVGAGIEYALDNNWHLKAEYLYADYGNKSVSYDQGKGIRSNITTNTVRVGLSYRFGGMSSAPVMARY